jgi:hypothetical protein
MGLKQTGQGGRALPRSLNGNCVQVHDQLRALLQCGGVESHMTIGSMHGQGWDYFSTSVDELLVEMADPDAEREIRAHIWLTFNDGSVLDWTGQDRLGVTPKQTKTTPLNPAWSISSRASRTRCTTTVPSFWVGST